MAFKNLAALFQNRVYRFGDARFVSYKSDNRWHWLTWEEIAVKVREIGQALIAAGIQPGERISIFADNCPDWASCDLAILSVGAVTVPIYSTNTAEQAEYVLKHSEARIIFVSDKEHLQRVQSKRSSLPNLMKVVAINRLALSEASPGTEELTQFCGSGKTIPASEFYERIAQTETDSLATIIYTSGTTGEPKGVMLTHRNLLANVESCAAILPVGPGDMLLSFLPLSHTFERTGGFLAMMHLGARIAYAENLAKVPQNLQEVKPTILICVPRIFEKLYARVQDELARKPKWIQNLFRRATESSLPTESDARPRRGVLEAIYDRLFYRKIREQFGGQIRYMISGGAALNPKIAAFFSRVGFHILQGYGLTESSPVLTLNLPQKNKLGTVGPAIPGVHIKIADDGEVLARGENVMKGYYRNSEATAETIDLDGYLHTGDIGVLDADGYLRLTDRKKDIIVTSGGKNIAPQALENELKLHSLVEHACVVGEGRKYVSALIIPNFINLETKAKQQGIRFTDRAELISQAQVRQWYSEVVSELNSRLPSYETIKKFELLPKEFSIDGGEITPTLKLRRKIIYTRYQDAIERMYS